MSSILDKLDGVGASGLVPIFAILADTAIKGLVLIAAAAIAAYFLRKKSAAARHAVWTAAVVGHLALPVLTVLVPQWRLPIIPAPTWLAPQVAEPAGSEAGEPALGPLDPISGSDAENAVAGAAVAAPTGVVASESSQPAAARGAGDINPRNLLGLLWIVGTMLVLLRLAVGTWKVGQLARYGDRIDDGEWLSLTQRLAKRLGITRPLTLLRGDRLGVPVTWGVVYPAVLLPQESIEWPEERRRFVLVHEMAHVKRFDALTQLLSQMTVSIFWFDPFLWYAAHRMRVEREHACDDYVIRDGTTPSLYAGELLEMVRSIGSPSHESAAPAFAALAMARPSEFEGRMLAILDARQDRKTLGRRSAVLATVALALMVIPLAALRPFSAGVQPIVVASMGSAKSDETSKGSSNDRLSEIACDSVMRVPVKGGQQYQWTHLHSLTDDNDQQKVLEYLRFNPGRCAQAIVRGPATFEGDRLVSLASGSEAYLREISGEENRTLRIEAGEGGRLNYAPSVNGKPAAFDDATERWMSKLIPVALKETATDAPERVARWLVRGGVDRVLSEIRRIDNESARRTHYLALIDVRLSDTERATVRGHALRNLAGSSSDLKSVLARLPAGAIEGNAQNLRNELRASETSTDSANLLRQFASTDDPAMILMALQGAKELSSDEDRRLLLTTIAPKALGKKDATLRRAFFEAVGEFTSDTDLRVLLTTILRHGQADPEVTLAVFKTVETQMSSDEDKRVTLTGAVSLKLLNTPGVRAAFMTAARSMNSDTDFTALMQAALSQ